MIYTNSRQTFYNIHDQTSIFLDYKIKNPEPFERIPDPSDIPITTVNKILYKTYFENISPFENYPRKASNSNPNLFKLSKPEDS